MKDETVEIVQRLALRYPAMSVCQDAVFAAVELLITSYSNGGKLLICGNGGSAADSVHIVGELVKGFASRRPIPDEDRNALAEVAPADATYLADHLQGALPAISLAAELGLATAFANDVAADMVFAQQVYGMGNPGDVLLGISTSGNSINVVRAAQVARAFGVSVISLTGQGGGKLALLGDVAIKAPETEVYKIQELHLPVYHTLCLAVEAEFFGV